MNARADFGPGLEPEISQLRIPPNSIESESSVLGGLLLDNGAWDRVGDLLADADFYRYEHRLIYGAVGQLINANKPADVISVFERLKDTGKADEVGGLAYLNALAQFVMSASNIRRYAEIVREKSILRSLVSASDEISTAAFNTQGRSVSDILDDAQARLMALTEPSQRDDWQEAGDGMVEFLDGVQRRADGERNFVPTGIPELDEKLDGGMREGEVIVIAARPSVGKTALALSIGENVAKDGHPVGIMSMEMPKAQVQTRRVAMESRVPLHKLKRPERMSDFDWAEMSATVDTIRLRPVFISDQTGLNINQVRSKARALKRRYGLRVLAIDYIGLMEGTDRRADRRLQLGEASRGLKALAKELGITILLLAQLNRDVEKRPGMKPILSDLKECGDIEQDADIIVFVHRPFHVKPELGTEWKYYAELILGKVRDGATGTVPAMYLGECVRFAGWPTETPIPTSKVVTKGGDL